MAGYLHNNAFRYTGPAHVRVECVPEVVEGDTTLNLSAVWDTVDWSGRWVAYDLARIDILETAR